MTDDPILVRRARIGRLAHLGQNVGYLCFGLALVVFVVGFLVGGFTSTLIRIIVGLMVVGSVVLAPAIVAGYGVKAADREDREAGGRP